MKSSSKNVLRYLAGNENIETIPITELQKLVDENPYFPIGQYLLAKKLKLETSEQFIKQAQKAALYFPNPYWLHYQLTDETTLKKDTTVDEKIERDEPTPGLQLSVDKEATKIHQESTTDKQQQNEAVEEDIRNERANAEQAAGEDEIQLKDTSKTLREDYAAPALNKQVSQPEEEMAALARQTDDSGTEFLEKVDNEENTFTRDNIDQVIFETQTVGVLEATETLEEMAGVSKGMEDATENFLKESVEDVAVDASGDDSRKVEKHDPEPDEHERMFQNIKAMLDATSEEADADVKSSVVPIDPYYTIDYFASQGIKLDLEQNPKDELGQHLKKFTQWLKQMKKLGPEDATEVIRRTDTEADIQKIAESSNTVREVVTEAMALVLEKQGKKEKSIELYKKLSFLNPDKSAYFASKIKNLKGI